MQNRHVELLVFSLLPGVLHYWGDVVDCVCVCTYILPDIMFTAAGPCKDRL